MKQSGFRLGGRGVLMLAIAAAYPTAAQSAPAARVEFAIGNPTAQGPAGTVRPLLKGVEVTTGDLIDTHDGRVQLRFVDGAYVSLQPQSQFRIDDFRYNGKQDGTEKGFFSLVKGGLRTITGLVGRNNKNAYLVTTSVATIGIRGTEYTIQYGKSVSGSVGEGEIKVCNGGGCLNVNNGESYYVQSPDVKPQLTDKKVDLPPQQPQSTPATFVQAENRSATGDPISFILTGPQTVHFAYVEGSFPPGPVPNTAAVFDETGALRQADFGGTVKYWSGPVFDQGNDGIIAWSRWTGDFVRDAAGNPLTDLQSRSLHNVAGLPTSSADLSQLNLAQLKGTYELTGHTTPTWSSGGVAGSLSGASLVANFGTMQVTGSVAVNIGGTDYSGTTLGSISSIGSSTFTGFGGSSAGALNFSGFFAGTNAMRAGMAYDLWVPGGQVQGAAAFTQTSLTNPSGATVPPP